MHIRDLQGKRVCILGFGKEGRATLAAIEKYAPKAKITIADKSPDIDVQKMDAQLGEKWLTDLDRFDVVIKSPGIPPSELRTTHYKLLTNSTQIFLDSVKKAKSMVIGVTGSKGKSTTASLIYAILKAAGTDVHLVGNIGVPALGYLEKAKKGTTRDEPDRTIFVMEMSSYQLKDLKTSPDIAVITSFFPEHLDYHGSEEAYKEAKKHIACFQKKGDVVFYNQFAPVTQQIAKTSKGKKIKFSWQEAPLRIEETKLLGHHNLSNIAAAFAVAKFLKIPKPVAQEAIRNFDGLPHRLQMLGNHGGIEWVDDAISTTPESAIAALEALGDRVSTIILGGQDRGNDFSELGRKIAASKIAHVILFPGSGPRIREAIDAAGASVKFWLAASMDEAVTFARTHTPKETICLLSTASPSYNMFKNFEEKGMHFRRSIENLKTLK
ncbi:UDP-N-acetylmuramoyl-L-alanine--D-glutamate ligase [Candidatus Peregrinibacteria bacterium]|nr:UDP-N-acetylmuramoyl-L-alanine--D-glutamate ligase [Candidatus Peregrinibacteria bacterium]